MEFIYTNTRARTLYSTRALTSGMHSHAHARARSLAVLCVLHNTCVYNDGGRMSRLLGENLQATSAASSRNRCNIISYALKDVCLWSVRLCLHCQICFKCCRVCRVSRLWSLCCYSGIWFTLAHLWLPAHMWRETVTERERERETEKNYFPLPHFTTVSISPPPPTASLSLAGGVSYTHANTRTHTYTQQK